MSRNFQLMQQLEIDSSLAVTEASAPVRPRLEETPVRLGDNRWASEEALSLVQRVILPQSDRSPRMVVFTGVNHGDGCTGVCTAVAGTLAANGLAPICIVEANFRSPSLNSTLGAGNHRGLVDALRKEGPIRSFANPVGSESLWLLPCGMHAVDSANLLSSERARERFAELREEFSFVVIDAPPLTKYTDALALGQIADGLVLILEAETTRREAAQVAVTTLRSSKIPILGAVLNKRKFPIPAPIYKLL